MRTTKTQKLELGNNAMQWSQLGCIVCFIAVLTLSSCANEFETEENTWELVTTSLKGVKAYVDKNRVECDKTMCKAWTKLVFLESTSFSKDEFKDSDNPQINLNSKRIDSMIYFYCFAKKSMMTSYQLYDANNKLINTRWINKPELTYIQPNSIEYDVFQYVCRPLLEEKDKESVNET
ncbi:MAG: surface-adhesin E family protein [bacterium]